MLTHLFNFLPSLFLATAGVRLSRDWRIKTAAL